MKKILTLFISLLLLLGLMRVLQPCSPEKLQKRGLPPKPKEPVSKFIMEETFACTGIIQYKVISDGPDDTTCRCGMWMEIHK